MLAGSFASMLAQTAGDMFVGTMMGVSVAKTSSKLGDKKYEDKPVINMEVDPGFHYFVAKNFRVGLQVGLHRMSQKDDNDNKDSYNALAVGPVAAYYINITDRFSIAPELGFYFAHAKNKYETSAVTTETKYNGFELDANLLNFEFRPVTHFGVGASLLGLSFAHLKEKDSDPEASSNSFIFSLGLNPRVGVRYFF